MLTLVTGATGYIGVELIRQLRAHGRDVRALVRTWNAEERLAGTGAAAVLGDVTAPETLPAALEGVSRVFHLAGVVGHRTSDEARLQRVNVDGAKHLLDAAARAGVERVVFTSSVGAMGPAASPGYPRSEQHSLLDGDDGRGDFRYARSKARGEEHALTAAREGLDVVIVNPGFVLGPGDVHRVSAWPIEEYLRGLLRFTVHGGLSYVDVRDVAAGHLLAEERGRTGERYILTNDEGNLPYPEFFDRVGDAAGHRRWTVKVPVGALTPGLKAARILRLRMVPLDEHELRSGAYWWYYTAAKAREQLGFTTRPLDETLADTVEWFRADGYRRH
ncbi:MAG TPA: NAD-dependent epimerase/dehydratase family protein [Gaiellales bacterium]|jgi:dihydroflavonol-4-reductase